MKHTLTLNQPLQPEVSSLHSTSELPAPAPTPPAAAPPPHPGASLWSRLTDDQRTTLRIWLSSLSLAEVKRRVAAPPPQGFGLRTHITTLQRLRASDRAADAISSLQETLDTVEDIEKFARLDQTARIQQVIQNVLHDHALKLSVQKPDSPELPRLVSAIAKLSALENQRQRLLLDREKLIHSAAVRHHRVDLNLIRGDPASGPVPVRPELKEQTRDHERASLPPASDSVPSNAHPSINTFARPQPH